MSKSAVLTTNAPPPLANIFSQAIIANSMVYYSSTTSVDPATGKLVEGDVKARTVSCSSQCTQQDPLPLT